MLSGQPPAVKNVSGSASDSPDAVGEQSEPIEDVPNPGPSPGYKYINAKPSTIAIGENFPLAAAAKSKQIYLQYQHEINLRGSTYRRRYPSSSGLLGIGRYCNK
jgi:hypothetical protein